MVGGGGMPCVGLRVRARVGCSHQMGGKPRANSGAGRPPGGAGDWSYTGATPTNTGQHNNTSMLLVLHKSHRKLTDLRLKVEIGNWMEDI